MGLLNVTQQAYHDGNDHGNYQFTSLNDVINQFIIAYVGEDKIISKAKRTDVAFHAQRAMQELSFDTFKSCKAQEITVPATLQMTLPQDYVNYTKISWVDSAGIKHLLYPTSKTSNPSSNPFQDSAGSFTLQKTSLSGPASGDNDLILNGTHNDIIVGMLISGPFIPAGATVLDVDQIGSNTVLFIQDPASPPGTQLVFNQQGPSGVVDIVNSGATYTFTNVDGSLILPERPSVQVTSLSFNTAFNVIVASTGTTLDTSGLEVGMLVNNRYFPQGTVITHVNPNDSIIVSNPPSSTVLVDNISFISPDKVDTDTWANYKSATPSENQDDYQDDTYWPLDGQRYGLDPQHAQANGSFYIDCVSGKIHFSSNVSGKTVILDYISDSLGTDDEMQVHKFAEEAMYKHIAYAILSTSSSQLHQQLAPRFKKEKFAATRQAKLRLSNIKLEELTQILRGKSKQIKH